MAEVHKIGIDGVDSADLAAYATVTYSDQQDGVLQTQIDSLRRDPGSIAVIDSDNPVVYADGAQATRDEFGGWRYINAGGGEKINWYTLIQAPNPENALLLGQFKNFWYTFLPRTDTTQIPFITVYTYPELTPGNAAVWYRSRRTYHLNNPDPWEQVNGVYIQHLMYAGTDPLIKDDAPHWELTLLSEEGPLAANEKIMYISIGTDSGQAAGNYNFAINSSGSRWENGWYANILRGVEDTSGFQLTSAATATHDNLQTQIDGILAQLSAPAALTTQEDFYRQAVTDMNNVLALTDNFIYREAEYKKVLPARIEGNGSVNAFSFKLTDLYKEVKGWREDIMQTTVARFNAIKAGADATAWQAALDNNVFATPTDDAIAALVEAINNQGTFQTTSDTSDWGAVPVVNSVYQYRLEMVDVVEQQLHEFWQNEHANSTLYREAERIKVGNSNGSYLHEQIVGNVQYENWYKGIVAQFVSKMDAIMAATTYAEADTAYATAISITDAPTPIKYTAANIGWARRTDESTDPYNALVSARAKLVALGLTDNEALALASYEGDNSRMLSEWV